MVFDLCLSVAAGEPFLGCRTHQHGALYLALEDGKGRLQDRMQKVLNKRPIPPAMRFLIDAPRIGEGLEEKLGAILDKNPDIGLVCIDTLSLVKPKERAFENVYSADYSFMRVFKKITESRGICILLERARIQMTLLILLTVLLASWAHLILAWSWTKMTAMKRMQY